MIGQLLESIITRSTHKWSTFFEPTTKVKRQVCTVCGKKFDHETPISELLNCNSVKTDQRARIAG